MSTATVHHLPGAAKAERLRDLDEQAKGLAVGQQVRVTWHNTEDGSRGTVEGKIARPSRLRDSLWVGTQFPLVLHGHVNVDVTAIETEPRPVLDMDTLSERVALWCDAQLEFENKPVGRFGTGDNTAEENAMLEAEDYVRAYLRSVQL
jgi:hypothetical protein